MANLITLSRIIAVIIFVGVFTMNTSWNMTAALCVFILAALSDAVDGWVARRFGEESRLGAALDPIADKLLITAALILLIGNGVISGPEVYAAIAIPFREILASGLREALAADGAQMPVTRLAKAKTVAQSLAIALLIATAPSGLLSPQAAIIGDLTLWIAAGLTIWTGLVYVRFAVQELSPKPKVTDPQTPEG